MFWPRFRIACLVLGLTGLLLAVGLYYRSSNQQREREAQVLRESHSQVLGMALKINRNVNEVVTTARTIANDLTGQKLTYDQIEARLQRESAKVRNLQALGVAFEPFVYQSNTRLYAPYYARDRQNRFQLTYLEKLYDYIDPPEEQDNWYARALELNGTWSEPIQDVVTGKIQVIYAVPFYHFDQALFKQVPAGVVVVAITLDDIQQLVKDLDLGNEGYGYLISKQGNYLVNPDPKLVNTSIFDHAAQIGDTALNSDGQMATKGQLLLRDGVAGGRPCWYFYEPIPSAGWSIGIVLQKDPNNEMATLNEYNLVKIGLVTLLALVLLSVFAFKLRPDSLFSLWAVFISSAFLMITLTGVIWSLEINGPPDAKNTVLLTSNAVLKQQTQAVDAAFQREGLQPPTRIPTGIFIESFAIEGRSITYSGYLWQKYPENMIHEIQGLGLIFPDAQSEMQSEAYRFTENGIVTIGYYFRVSLLQTFDAARYPLDEETIWLQVMPASLDSNILLVPDLDAYSATNPSALPGMARGILLNNWRILGSSFSYATNERETTFGSSSAIKQYNLPTLSFDVIVGRFIVPSLLSYGITTLVIAILIFSLVVSKAEKSRAILTEASALFFVLVVAHVGLRSELASQGVVYLEALFILLYGLILLGVLNGLLSFVDFKVPFFSYRGGLLFKLLYWPILTGAFLTVTLLLFYPNLF